MRARPGRRRTGIAAVPAAVAVVASAVLAVVAASTVAPSPAAGAQVRAQVAREPWLRPFSSRSIWNSPIGSNARYVPAGLPAGMEVHFDKVPLLRLRDGDPVRQVLDIGSFTNRCSGTRPGAVDVRIPIPDAYVLPDARPPDTPNNASAMLMPDGRTVVNLGVLARCVPGGPVYAHLNLSRDWVFTDLYGDGRFGSHGGSGLSSLGGAIRPGELTGDEPIRHALDLAIWGRYLRWTGSPSTCFRWPAAVCDSYAATGYQGTNPALMMGSLLALTPDLTPERLGVTTAVGRRIFQALQDYGGYVTEDSAWNAVYLGLDSSAGGFTFGAAERAEIARMAAALSVVDNNGPTSVGGGGTPRRPLLDELVAPGQPTTCPASVTGYALLAEDGTVRSFGLGGYSRGAVAGVRYRALVPVPPCSVGAVAEDGRVDMVGPATAAPPPAAPRLAAGEQIVAAFPTASGRGSTVVTSRGQVAVAGDAGFFGDASRLPLNQPIVGATPTGSGRGYWLVAADGGVFAYGDARFFGSMGGRRLNQPVRGMAVTPGGNGYWLVAADGGVFAFGDAPFRGSLGSLVLNRPVTGMTRYGDGYLLVGADGGIFVFSRAPFLGSTGSAPPTSPVVAIAAFG